MRVSAFLLAVFFLLCGAESAFGMRACPHHDVGHAMAGHGMVGHHGMGAPSDQAPQPSHTAPCTCQGACQMGVAAALPEPALVSPSASIVLVEVPAVASEAHLARRHSPFFLPYSQAPPRVG